MKKILVIDDELGTREALSELLGDDYEVLTAEDGEKGIALIDKERPDLVISDVDIPRASGVEVLQYVKDNYPDMKFFVMSAGGTSSIADLRNSFMNGCDAFFAKPFENEEILDKVKELLGE